MTDTPAESIQKTHEKIKSFLIFTYFLVLACWIASGLLGFVPEPWREYGLLGLQTLIVFAPAFAAARVGRKYGESHYHRISIWPINYLHAAAVLALTIAIIALSFSIASLLGLMRADWSVPGMIAAVSPPGPDGAQAALSPFQAIAGGFAVSIIVGVPLFSFWGLGIEYGFRFFLVEKLCGITTRPRAYILAGLLSSVIAFPYIFNSLNLTAPDLFQWIRITIAAIAFGSFLAEVLRRSESLGLTAFAFGCYMSQVVGVWNYVFTDVHPIFGGPTGLIASAFWGGAAIELYRRPEARKVRRTTIRRAVPAPLEQEIPSPQPKSDTPPEPIAEPDPIPAIEESPIEEPALDIAAPNKPEPQLELEAVAEFAEEEEQPAPKKTAKKKKAPRKRKSTKNKTATKKKPAKKKKSTRKRTAKKKKAAKKKPAKKKPAKKKSSGD